MKAILHLTRDCNLRCKYCYAPAKTKESMSTVTAHQAIDLAIALGKRSACISYFGGEPLLMFDRIVELTEYARAAGQQCGTEMHFRMSTNGTLFDDEILRFCRDNNLLFAISLDGDQAAHDAQRVRANGAGSWQLIDDKLDQILYYNPHTVVTSVVTPATVSRLAPSLEYMWGRGLRYIVHQLDFTHPDWTSELLTDLADSYRAMAAFYLDKMRAGERFHLSIFDDKLRTHTQSPIELGQICDFGTKKISIASDGRIFPCVQFVSDRPDADDYCIGNVSDGLNERRDQLVMENRRERAQCRGCVFVGRCANYCGCLNWQLTGELTVVHGLVCAHEQMLIPIADEIGNQLWNERNGHFLARHYRDHQERFRYSVD